MSGVRAFFSVLRRVPRSQKRNFLVAQFGVVLMVATQLMIPQLIQRIIDDGILADDTDQLVSSSFLMIVFSIINLAVAAGVAYLSAATATNLAHAVRSGLYESITGLSHGNIDRMSTGNLLVLVTSDVNIMKTSWMMTMYMLFQAPWMMIGAVVLVWMQTPQLLWIMALAMIIVVAVVLVIAPALGPLYARVQVELDRLNNIFQESIAGVRVVKAFDREELETERFQAQNSELYQAQLRPAFRVALFQPILFAVLYAAIGIAVVVVGSDIADGVIASDPDAITAGQLTTFFNYLMTAMVPIMIVAFVLPELGKFEASLNRAIEVFEAEADVKQPVDAIDPGQIQGHIEFRNVTMAYLGDNAQPLLRPALIDVSFVVEPGETVAILGQTGSGKTTLVSLIPRFYDVTDGAVLVDGHDVRTLDLAALRHQISTAEQQAMLFAGTFDDNLRYGTESADLQEIRQAAGVADADEFISSQVDGYDGMVAEQGSNLSGGQRQRVSLARAIASDPRILILDDTTSAVDAATEARIQDGLATTMAGRTVIIVAQRVSTAISADKIILLDEGSVVEIGTHTELLARSPLYGEIVESQLGAIDEIADLLDQR